MIRVSEIFGPTIQGEGAQIGRPTVFVRTGGCDYRCAWCDTMYAVDPKYRPEWTPMTAAAILDRVVVLAREKPLLVTLSGGNPVLQPLGPLIDLGHKYKYTFTLETQGSAYRAWIPSLDHLCLSPKPPSAGNITSIEDIARYVDRGVPEDTILKIVVFDDDDFRYARAMCSAFPQFRTFLQVGNTDVTGTPTPTDLLASYKILVERVIESGLYHVTVLPQLHTLLWGNTRAV